MKTITNTDTQELKSKLNEELFKAINRKLANNENVLFLLSGGSATEIALSVLERVSRQVTNLALLTISLVDERWMENPNHDESNWKPIETSSVFQDLSSKGVHFYEVLNGKSMKDATRDFDVFLQTQLSTNKYIIAIFGIGEDGHTAGIFSSDLETFNKTYKINALAVSHSISPKSTPTRITISPKTITAISEIFIIATGEAKKEKLFTLNRFRNSTPTPQDIAQQPSLLTVRDSTRLYTDQVI